MLSGAVIHWLSTRVLGHDFAHKSKGLGPVGPRFGGGFSLFLTDTAVGLYYPYRIRERVMNYPKTRKAAKAIGASHYFTGNPCVRGHVALRKTKGACVECLKEDWEKDNQRRKTLPKSEAAKAAGRRYYERNKDLVLAKANNQPPEQRRAARRAWKQRNPEAAQASANAWKRRARHATPRWLTPTHKAQIRAMYLAARRLTKETGIKHVVDHIVPLRSDCVCGLHVPWNLQILTHSENCAKGNRLV